MRVESYKDLIVWQKAMQLIKCIYGFSDSFPAKEMYGLTSQMRRAAVSIPSNIAEGSRRGSRKDYRQFLLIAFGSGSELETQLDIAVMLGFASSESPELKLAVSLLIEVMKMLNTMIRKLSSSEQSTHYSLQPTH